MPSASQIPHRETKRIQSLDAYRGLVMILLVFNGFGLHEASLNFRERPGWKEIGAQFEHAAWTGCSLWDLIQPSFMFVVGASCAFSLSRRRDEGESWLRQLGHALYRSALFILAGVLLTGFSSKGLFNPNFMNVLTQIGLGYLVLFLLAGCHRRVQGTIAIAILIAYWMFFALWPLPPETFDWPAIGVPLDWPHRLTGFMAHWNKNSNPAAFVDTWLLNLLPRSSPFRFNAGGYATLNFIPSTVTMLFGLMTAQWLKQSAISWHMGIRMVMAGIFALALGQGLHEMQLCPIVKRIWTPAWTIFSAGWCLLIWGGLHSIIRGEGARVWTFPLFVAGSNSLLLYILYLERWALIALWKMIGLQDFVSRYFGGSSPILMALVTGMTCWLIAWGLYRNRVFLRV